MNIQLGKQALALFCTVSMATAAAAQISSNPDKFLGNITTSYQIDYGNVKFYQLWNQITPENESKWDQIEGQRRGTFNWNNVRNINNYANLHHFPMKFHTLVWGNQYPKWMDNLSKTEQLKAVTEWMDAIKEQFPNLTMIDVVNEAVSGHAPAPYKEALGGDGLTGYDWIIKAFEMAHQRWPDAILIYNDYNTFQWNTDDFINLVRTLRDAGAPIDAYGCQSHELTDCSKSTFQQAMTKIQNALKMPMYITEYDIATENDNYQKQRYQEQLPLMWEADYCAGVTLWGYIYGKTWTKDGNSGLIRSGQDRPAMTWLKEYMQTDKAKSAKSPFPGGVKEASVYVKPQALRVPMNKPASIEVRARLKTKTIERVEFYVNNGLRETKTETPYIFEYTPKGKGKFNLKAVVVATDGTKYERLSSITSFEDLGDREFTTLSQLTDGQPFSIICKTDGKAFCCTDNQNLGYDNYNQAFSTDNVGYTFKLVGLSNVSDATINKCYLLRQLTVNSSEYNIWGSPGYLNSQPASGNCSFILGLNNQYGQDIKNGAVWEIKYVEGRGFTMRNIGTGLYLHDNGPAKYDEPAYFSFCTTGFALGVDRPATDVTNDAHYSPTDGIYTIQGVRVGDEDQWYSLPRGLYIVNGKKTIKR